MNTARPSPLSALAPLVGAVLLLVVTLAPVLGDLTGRFLGDGTDALHHAWGLWWARVDGHEGAITPFVSFPTGERGALLSPMVTLASAPFSMLGGPALAYNAAVAGVLLGALAGVGALAGRLTGGARGALIAALALLVGRPLQAQLGMGVLEGLIIGPAAAALLGLLAWVRPASPSVADEAPSMNPARYPWSFALGLLAALSVVENPYALVLVGPAAALAAGIRLRDERRGALGPVLAALLGGLGGVGLRLLDAGGDLGGNAVVEVHFRWAGRWWSALEGEGGLAPAQLFSPLPMANLSASAATLREQGGHVYLGWSVLLLAAAGALIGGGVGRAGLLVAGLSLLLAGGSLPGGQGGSPGPFFFLNLALSQLGTPLTQPVRFLSLASGALAVAAAAGATALARRFPSRPVWELSALALALDGLILGGPALSMPSTDLRADACFADLAEDAVGGVHLVPPKGESAELANRDAVRLQLLHRLPGTHRGVGGWTQEPRDQRFDQALSAITQGLRATVPSPAWRTALSTLQQRGLAWLIVDQEQAPQWLGVPLRSCDGWSAWRVSDLGRSPY